ncbi:MAG: type II toxin-antitoxin system VapC family toxin [Flavobacteriales bacterium]|jgi:predicted nucleic acid-binding protein|nr:type II toxin-antitoxin system VapC family toxin [Flavobacteriales bacterium]
MSGDRVVADTSALIHLLEGQASATRLLQSAEVFVSFISEIELLSSKRATKAQLEMARALLNDCTILDPNDRIKELTIDLRRRHGLKVPDCLIAATSIHMDLPLITSDHGFERLKDELLVYWL